MNKKRLGKMVGIILVSFLVLLVPANTQIAAAPDGYYSTPAVGQICLMAFNYAPQGWADCNGSLMLISQNQALYSLIGTKFGGSGSTFALPNLQSPIPGTRYCIALDGMYPPQDGGSFNDPILGQIDLFPYDFTPAGWLRCEGQTIQLSQNTALFSILGFNYGGDGATNFKIPDLRGTEPNNNIHYCMATQGLYPIEGSYSNTGGDLIGSIILFPRARFEGAQGISNGICDGNTLNIATDNRLFASIGTTYGGDGTSTFAKPDLRGAVPDPRLGFYIQVGGSWPVHP
ncbi:MAG: tail fiber protein [Chitinophagales bacterium]